MNATTSATVDYNEIIFVESPKNVSPNPELDKALERAYVMTGELHRMFTEVYNPIIRDRQTRYFGLNEQSFIEKVSKESNSLIVEMRGVIDTIFERLELEIHQRLAVSPVILSYSDAIEAADRMVHKVRNKTGRIATMSSIKINTFGKTEISSKTVQDVSNTIIGFRTQILSSLLAIQDFRRNLLEEGFVQNILSQEN